MRISEVQGYGPSQQSKILPVQLQHKSKIQVLNYEFKNSQSIRVIGVNLMGLEVRSLRWR
jgi:hypothetical protein